MLDHIDLSLVHWWPKVTEMVVSDHHLEILMTQSTSSLVLIHLLHEPLEVIWFLAVLAQFWPSDDQKMTKDGDFHPLP